MTVYYYDNALGNTTSSDGLNDILLGSALSYRVSLATMVNKYVPYYLSHNTLVEWEYGLGQVVLNGSQYVLTRDIIYTSSNSNNKVSFSAGIKSIVSTIDAERINHGGYNFTTKSANFTADTVQTIYGISGTGNITVSLPPASGNKNLLLGFRTLPSFSNTVYIDASGSELIDATGIVSLSSTERYLEIISDGSGWYQLNRSMDVTGAGVPGGSNGSIQYKASASDFGGNSQLFWESTSGNLLVGNTTVSTANIILPSSSGQNTVFNNLAYNSDFQVKGTGTTNQLYFDASAGRLGINTNNPSTILHIVGKCANDTMKLESTTQCATGVALTLYHSPSTGSSSGDYPATINLDGRNSNAEQIHYAQIRSRILGADAGSTSGELIINVDNSGISKSVIVASPLRTIIGLSTINNYSNNIIVGNNSADSGINNITVGNSSAIGGSAANNFIGGHSNTLTGSNNFVIGNSGSVFGTGLSSIGSSNIINGSTIIFAGSSSSVSGQTIVSHGNSNSISGTNICLLGHNNLLSSFTSGVLIGHSNNARGSGNTINGINVQSTGNNNLIFGSNVVSSGNNNSIIGNTNICTGNDNLILGYSNTLSNSSGIIIGNNIISSATGVVLGLSAQDIVISNTGIGLNYDGSKYIVLYGSSSGNYVKYTNNNIGINKEPSGYILDINGTIRSSGIYTNSIRFGAGGSGISGTVLSADASGNASWKSLAELQGTLGISSGNLVWSDGDKLLPASGSYFNNSGIYTSSSGNSVPYVIIPTGNTAMVVNASNLSLSNVFNIRGSGQNNLFVADASNNRIGINVASPTHTISVSGSARLITSSLSFIEKTDNDFTFVYDTGPFTQNRLSVSSSGIIITQGTSGTILPEHTFVSTPNITASNLIKHVVFDTNTNSLKYSTSIVGGFQAFQGSTDS